MGGVPSYRRTGRLSAFDPKRQGLSRVGGGLKSWSVGRFYSDVSADIMTTVWEPDLRATRKFGIHYMPVLFSGYSFANTNGALGQPPTPSNQIVLLWLS